MWLSSRLSEAHGGIYAVIGYEMLTWCVDSSTRCRSLRMTSVLVHIFSCYSLVGATIGRPAVRCNSLLGSISLCGRAMAVPAPAFYRYVGGGAPAPDVSVSVFQAERETRPLRWYVKVLRFCSRRPEECDPLLPTQWGMRLPELCRHDRLRHGHAARWCCCLS